MRTIYFITTALILLFAVQSTAVGQSAEITELFKNRFNETVQQVHQTDDPDEKRLILNESFTRMLGTLKRVENIATLNEEQSEHLALLRSDISEKQKELNGLDGYEKVSDQDLDEFSSYSQEMLEQANRRTVTIGVSTLLVLLIILLLI